MRPRRRPRPSRRRPAPPRSRHRMATQKEVKNRIASVKNINKITRAMEMVAAARLRRAEQRIDALRPYAQAMRKLTRQVAEAAGAEARACRCSQEREEREDASGSSWSPATAASPAPSTPTSSATGMRLQRELASEGTEVGFSVVGRRGVSALTFRKRGAPRRLRRLHRPPGLRQRARDRRGADRPLRRRGARPGRADLQPLRLAADPVRLAADAAAAAAGRGDRRGRRGASRRARPRRPSSSEAHRKALWDYEPEPEELLAAADPRVREHLGLPGAARVGRLRAGGADDRDAQRGGERRDDDRRPDPGDEPGPAGGDHPGDPRGRRAAPRRSVITRLRTTRRRRPMADNGNTERNVGTRRAGDRRRRRRRLPRPAAGDLLGGEDRDPAGDGDGEPTRAGLRGAAAPRRRPRPHGRDGRDRRPRSAATR